jgi:hypothetical protein
MLHSQDALLGPWLPGRDMLEDELRTFVGERQRCRCYGFTAFGLVRVRANALPSAPAGGPAARICGSVTNDK